MLDAYCWPLSAAPGETVLLHVSGDVGSCTIEITRSRRNTGYLTVRKQFAIRLPRRSLRSTMSSTG